MSFYMTGKHRTAAYEYSRNVDPCRCHQKARYVFVTVGNHDQSIELMSQCHGLCGICDQVTCYKGIFHSNVSHCDSVTYCDRRKYNRCAASHCNAELYSIYNFVKVHMTRYDLVVRAYDSYQWFVHFFFCHSKGIEQGTVWCLLCAFSYSITSHFLRFSFLFFTIWFYISSNLFMRWHLRSDRPSL